MKFDQLAVIARDEYAQQMALTVAEFPVRDVVRAVGRDNLGRPIENIAELAFNYTLWPMEYEVLRYVAGWNWHMLGGSLPLKTSHFGVHVDTAAEVEAYREQYGRRVLQEVVTQSHTNLHCQTRRYHYLILDAQQQLGTALKVIRRLRVEEAEEMTRNLR